MVCAGAFGESSFVQAIIAEILILGLFPCAYFTIFGIWGICAKIEQKYQVMNKETFFEEARARINQLKSKEPLPFWMTGKFLPEDEVSNLSELSQIEYGITLDLAIKGTDPDSLHGRREVANALKQVLQDYSWLS